MKKKELPALGWCFLIAFLLLMICSRSSFLYPCNDWNDANSYFTMGKGLMNGQIIYRDLYDQKGPYLYLLYGLSYLLSNTTFYGVFFFEILAVGVFLFSCYKIMNIFCSERVSAALLPVLGAVLLASKSFYWGGAAEEFCLPLLGISLLISIQFFRGLQAGNAASAEHVLPTYEAEGLSAKQILILGICAGIIMQIKYNILGFHIALGGMIFLVFLIRKEWKNLIRFCTIFVGGMVLTAVPWFIFLGVNGALDDWYQCYVYNNVFLYSNLAEEAQSFGSRIYTLIKLLYWLILDNLSYFAFTILGMVYFLFMRFLKWYEKVNLIALFVLTFLGIYVGGSNLPYYAIPMMVFGVLGMVVVGRFIDVILKSKTQFLGRWIVAYIIVMACSLMFVFRFSTNTPFMKQDQDTYFLYAFADVIEQETHNQEEEPTLVTVNCLDAGLYTVANIVPSCRFFQTNGINFKEMFEEQEQYIRQGKTQFVLMRDDYGYPEYIEEQYQLIAQAPYTWDGLEFTYGLFMRK